MKVVDVLDLLLDLNFLKKVGFILGFEVLDVDKCCLLYMWVRGLGLGLFIWLFWLDVWVFLIIVLSFCMLDFVFFEW